MYSFCMCWCFLAINLNLQTHNSEKRDHYFSTALNFGRLFLDENSIPFECHWKTWQQAYRHADFHYKPDRSHSICKGVSICLCMRHSLIGKMCRQTDRRRGNLIHYSSLWPYSSAAGTRAFISLRLHDSVLLCAGMYAVSCLSVHTDTHPPTCRSNTEICGRVVGCFGFRRSWLKISVWSPVILIRVCAEFV
jgi:hypothetical protein